MDFTEMLVRVVSFPWVNPQEKRQATAPAVMAVATEEPVCRDRREVPGGIPGPCTSTPGAAKIRLDLSGGGEAAAAVDVKAAGNVVVCADG